MKAWLVPAGRQMLGALLLAGTTVLLRTLSPNPADVALAYLLVVLAASTVGGLWSGTMTSVAAMLAFNYFFLPPSGTLTIADPANWFALVAFLVTAGVSSQLVARTRARSRQAELRERQARLLLELSERILARASGPADIPGALAALAQDCAKTLRAERAAVQPWGPEAPGAPQPTPAWPQPWLDAVRQAVGRSLPRAPLQVPVPGGGPLLVLPLARHGPHPALLLAAGPRLEAALAPAVAGLASLALDRLYLLREATEAEALRQSDRLRSALLAGVSHQLRTPLAAIRLAATALQRRETWEDAASRGELLQTMDEESERLNRLFSNLLCMSRIEAGALALERGSHEVAELVWEGVQQAGLRPATVRWSLPEDLPPICCDLGLGALVLANLLDNAHKYAPAGSPIGISGRLSSDGRLVAVAVEDEGPGVPPPEAERIFERFYRYGPPGGPAGTGLGLSIVRALVEAHGGRAWVEARAGGGSRFTTTWPAAGGEAGLPA